MAPYLVVGAVLLLALAALQQVSGGAASLGHLMLPDGLLGQSAPQLLQLVTGHLLQERSESRDRMREKETDRVIVGKSVALLHWTSADMAAMRLSSMVPARTFLRRPGFFGSFKLLMRLRTRFLYFMSVAFNSW